MTINNFLRKERIFYLTSFLAIISLLGCQKQPVLNFGSNFLPDNASANIVRVDTTTVQVSTVYTDSVRTAGTGYLMIGNLNDPYFGNVYSRAFLQVAPPSNLPSITQFDTYDSIRFLMLFKKGNPYYGDTTARQYFTVSQVDTLYQLPAFSNGFWSNYSFPIDPTPFGSSNAVILPNVGYTDQRFGDTVKIPIPDAFGKRLYNMIYNNSDSITKLTNWLAWFHGLCVSPDVNSRGAIYGFRDSAIMRIYYHQANPSAYNTESFIDFGITNKSYQFNNVIYNSGSRQGTPLAMLDTPIANQPVPPATPSKSIGNAGYMSSFLGMDVKLTFPYINTIALRNDFLEVLRAELSIQPVQPSFSTTWFLPTQIAIGTTDYRNGLITSIPGPTGAQYGNLTPNYLLPLNMIYTYDISSFIKAQITNTSSVAPQSGVLLYVPPGATQNLLSRIAITDQTYPVNQRVTLSVYYISLYPHN